MELDRKLGDGPRAYIISSACREVVEEIWKAVESYPQMSSTHEGWAIIKEELDELWEEIRKKPDVRDKFKMRVEAKQVAAMAIRFMADLT